MSTDQVKEMLLKNSPRKGVTEIPFLAGLWASCLLCYKDLSKTFSGSSVGGATADMGLSRNVLREWENKLASTFAFCLALTFPVEFRYSARIPG
jgi:fermentation-respiration switch protein FrsA (DUF1100 family)